MNFILTLLILMIILGVIITIHEFGHFIAAKKNGVYIDEFSIGMGPLIITHKPKNSETTYSYEILELTPTTLQLRRPVNTPAGTSIMFSSEKMYK